MLVWHPQLLGNNGKAMTGANASEAHDQFAEAFVRNQRRIYTYISTLLTNREDIEDVFQQTCVLLWKKWDQFRPDADFGSWACGIARNEVRNFLRVRRSKPAFSDRVLDELSERHVEFDRVHEDRHQALSACLDKLSAEQRELVEHCYQGKDSVKRVAERMHVAPSALYKKLHRIRRALLNCINLVMSGEGAQ